MNLTDFLGISAATLTTVAFIPQVIKTIRTRDTSSISLSMYTLFVAGIICWLLWGIAVHQWPVIIANAVTLALSAVILGMKIYDVLVKHEPL